MSGGLDMLAIEHRMALKALLTPRQVEVIECLCLGYGQRATAQRLHLSRATVRDHTDAALRNLAHHQDVVDALIAVSETIRKQALLTSPRTAGTPGQSDQDPPAPPIATGTP